MEKYHDDTTDEYSVDVEDVAASLLKKKLADLAPVEEFEQAAPKARKAPPAPAKRPSTPAARTAPKEAAAPKVSDATPEKFLATMQERQAWALERAARRARGEAVD